MANELSAEAKVVLRGYAELSAEDKSAFVDALNEYNRAPGEQKRTIKEGWVLGPSSPSRCPLCGK